MMGMSMAYQLQPQQQQHTQTQNQEPQVDWENQFKEIEELTNKAEEVEEIQREQSPEIVVDDKHQATFQVWDSLNSESLKMTLSISNMKISRELKRWVSS